MRRPTERPTDRTTDHPPTDRRVFVRDREYNRQTSPLDPSTPPRTLESSGTTVRLFEARTYANARVVLKEFLPLAKRLAQRELQVKGSPPGGWGG